MTQGRRYVVISPVRDEEEHVQRTIDSVAAQSEPPALWVIVDDGSSDRTPEILARATERHDWIRVVTQPPRTHRILGAGVIHAFNAGLASIDLDDFDYVSKLDGDLVLHPDYFAVLMDEMAADPRLATASGRVQVELPDGGLQEERGADEMSVGAAKLYRVSAFEDIGGLVPELMWDGIDSHEARRHGWRARSYADPRLSIRTLRPMGVSDRGIYRGKRRHGHGQWFMGTSPVFMVASAVRRFLDPETPPGLGSLHMLAGYAQAAWRRVPRYGDPSFRAQLRRFQLESLALGKSKATQRWEARTEGSWPGNVPDLAVAYLVSEYPSMSHSFIAREISSLREQGWHITPISLRQGTAPDTDETVTLRRLPLQRQLRHLAVIACRPRATLTTVRSALLAPGGRLRPVGLLYVVQAAFLLGEMRGKGLSHVHVHFANNASEVARLAALLATPSLDSRPLTWSLTVHGLWMHGATGDPSTDSFPHRFASRWGPLADKLRDAVFVTVVSDLGATALRPLRPDADVRVLHLGVDTEHFRPPTDVAPGRAEFTVLYVGRLAPEKNLPVLLRAVAALGDLPTVRLMIAGAGPLEDELRSLGQALGLGDRLTWLGPVLQDDLPSVYAQADVVALTSRNEGIPVTLMEAMSTGLPVVAPPVGGIPELVQDDVNGLLVPVDDVNATAAALRRLHDEPQLRTWLGRAARDTVRSQFDSRTQAAQLGNLLRAVLRPRANRLRGPYPRRLSGGTSTDLLTEKRQDDSDVDALSRAKN